MAEYSTPEERTELPTDRRMGEVRKMGALFVSNELVQVVTMLIAFLALNVIATNIYNKLKIIFATVFRMIGDKEPIEPRILIRGAAGVIWLLGPQLLFLIGVVATTATLAVMLQTGWNVKAKKIDFRWNFINPIGGIKKIFSIGGVLNTAKAILKLAMILPIGYFALQALSTRIALLPLQTLPQITQFTSMGMEKVFWKIFAVVAAIAIFDRVYGKYRWMRDNKMTKDEVKDERKSVEGDEATRRKIAAKGLQRMAQRIAQTVPKADVIITNPTHYAIALKYERGKMRAPVVLAKGQDYLALRIREIAKENNIPIVERKALARSLYDSTRIGAEIPYELFRAVAEVLAYVWRLKNPHAQPRPAGA